MADKKKNKKATSSNTLLAWVCVTAIAGITFLVFSPSLDDGFTNWDDNFYVTDNPLVSNNSIPFVKIFETPVSLHYHPLTVLSLALNYQNGKLNPFGYHFENVIFHLLNTILVFLFIFLLTRRNLLMAAIVALFFGIHPMHVESVTWVSERKDVLYVFFFMSGLITYLHYCETKKIVWYFITLLLFILSCLSKEMAVIFPVILLLIDYLKEVKWNRKIVAEKIPFFLLSLIIGIIEIKIQWANAGSDIKMFTVFERLLFASYASVIYIIKLFAPFKLSVFYPYPDIHSANGIPLIFYLSPVILAGILGGLAYCFLKKEKEIVVGLLFYFISVILVIQFGATIAPDRYSYLSYVGLLFVVAYLINKAWFRLSRDRNVPWLSLKYSFVLIAIIGAVVFSFQTYSRTKVWRTSETLWTNVIDNYPNAGMAYYNRAAYYYNNNSIENAMSDLDKDLQLESSNKGAYFNRGILYANYYNRNDLAIADYTKAISLDSAYKEAHFNRGLSYIACNKTDSALADFNKVIVLDPDNADAYNDRGLIYSKELQYKEAIADFSKAIEINPSIAGYWQNKALAESEIGQDNEAKADALKAQRLQGR